MGDYGGRLMDKEDILKLANNFWKESILANSYFSIIKQYVENYNKYHNEMIYSSAFYAISFEAIQNSLFMQLAKIYDKSKNAINIGYLLKKCSENIIIFPKYRKIVEVEVEGQKQTLKIPFQHQIKPTEECYFEKYVKDEREIREILGIGEFDVPIMVKLTIDQYIEMYQKRYHALNSKIDNLVKQRNKIYAHNDKELCFDIDDVLNKNPITYNDIQELIDYALDVSRFVIGCLDNVCKPKQYANIKDWEKTLQFVKLGDKYCDVEVKKQVKEFKNNIIPDDKE